MKYKTFLQYVEAKRLWNYLYDNGIAMQAKVRHVNKRVYSLPKMEKK